MRNEKVEYSFQFFSGEPIGCRVFVRRFERLRFFTPWENVGSYCAECTAVNEMTGPEWRDEKAFRLPEDVEREINIAAKKARDIVCGVKK